MSATHIACPLRIGAARTEIGGDGATARAALLEQGAVSISPAWEDGLLERLLRICRDGAFAPETIARVGSRTFEQDDLAGRLIRFLLERRPFLDWAQGIAGCERLQHATGLVGEMAPASGQGLDWHDDQNDGGFRRLAVTVHLSDAPYEGGVFEIREKNSTRTLFRQASPPPGTMTLFRIGPDLHHRVTPVTKGGPRRVFGGWLSV
ncbi:MAG TPA: 2OG-Fe(II) oxygenase [Sphingomonas sp.]|nr:2OG-Fe(II) oxygenase [Sphingomonas sp.]